MTERVDFYVLPSAMPKQRWSFGCRLIEKAYQRDLKVLIALDSEADAQALDELLWTFHERSFVPHHCCGEGECREPELPVHLKVGLEYARPADLLVNLSDRLPGEITRFARIAEIIDADPERRRRGRERFKAYREQQLSLETHQLGEGAEP
jgi:DNA polymerase III subunit chi